MDRRLTATQAAAMVGILPRSWRSAVARGYAPAADGREELSGTAWWWRSTVERYLATRPGRGAPGRPRKRVRTPA